MGDDELKESIERDFYAVNLIKLQSDGIVTVVHTAQASYVQSSRIPSLYNSFYSAIVSHVIVNQITALQTRHGFFLIT